MDAELKAAIDGIGSAFEAYKAANDERLAQISANGVADPTTLEKLNKIDATIEALGEIKNRQDALETKVNRPGSGGDKNVDPAVVAHRTAFMSYMRKGTDHNLAELERNAAAAMNAASVGSDPDGGYTVTPDMTGRIVTRVFDTSPIRQIANVMTITTDALEGLRDTDEATVGWVNEMGSRGTSATPQLGMWRIPTHEMFAQPEITQKLLDDSSWDIESWLVNKVSDKFARVQNTAFVVGTGDNKPTGFTSYPTAATADSSRGWGTNEHVPSGVTASFGTTGDPLFDLIGAFKPFYLQRARFVTNRAVIKAIRKLKGTGNDYLWQPGLQVGQPDALLGYPITMAEDMPAIGTNSLSLAFGDFGIAYQIVDRMGVRLLRDPFTNKPFVRLYTTTRVGGGQVQFEALKFLKFGTA